MNWNEIWLTLFGTTTWGGIDIGFYVSMGISVLVAVLMCVGFWCTKPLSKRVIKPKKHHN